MVKNSKSSSKQRKKSKLSPEKEVDWLDFVIAFEPRSAIPVSPRFQADLPAYTSELNHHSGDSESETLKWLGTRIWPTKGQLRDTNEAVVGRGRSDSCKCVSPGSVQCVKHHITDARIQLQKDLGPAFWEWKFDELGEEVSKLWTTEEQRIFSSLVKSNPLSRDKSFLQPAVQRFRSKGRAGIVRYYFDVYVPARIAMQTRSGCRVVDTDNEENEASENSLKDSKKRSCPANAASQGSNYAKSRYLAVGSLHSPMR